ncbi:DUF2986 domain-containing protein [Oceanospirillum sediminis]|uniref:DUF2986 domain-containing protein n=1 Tax=Oceanospirillum sediminis TaxID=2760088 RepID=A0A839IU30_9GAMM|nr:DUF2986 domain-containing protein [Oceanospirillum sediminis]MBB1488144.1 DUF2986 domain-containing protein [Oceanospirillum sediminis]
MNRKKKINQILTKKSKKANARKSGNPSKPRYISKAERARLEEASSSDVS